MSRESIFQSALSNFIFDFACGGAIRHLAAQGCTSRQIADRLNFPVPYERVREAVTEYLLEEGVLLRQEPVEGEAQEKYIYVQDHGKYGRTSFRRVPVREGQTPEKGKRTAAGMWTEHTVSCQELSERLREKGSGGRSEGGKGKVYVSCSFGVAGTEFEGSMVLDERQQEYLRGICWDRQPMYHLLTGRMREIVLRLCGSGFWRGKVYLIDTGEILVPEESGRTEDGSV